jgi:hypothetical protein
VLLLLVLLLLLEQGGRCVAMAAAWAGGTIAPLVFLDVQDYLVGNADEMSGQTPTQYTTYTPVLVLLLRIAHIQCCLWTNVPPMYQPDAMWSAHAVVKNIKSKPLPGMGQVLEGSPMSLDLASQYVMKSMLLAANPCQIGEG